MVRKHVTATLSIIGSKLLEHVFSPSVLSLIVSRASSEVAVDPSELNCCQVDTSETVDVAGMLTLALS